MSCEGIEIREGTASKQDIQSHLQECDNDFYPSLGHKVDIEEYATKIKLRARTFEAWSGGVLIGLVAAYLNDCDTRAGFITSVSVTREYVRRGIASALLDRCIDRSRAEGMKTLRLEVSPASGDAVRLYRTAGFAETGRHGEVMAMELQIDNTRKS